MQETDNNKNLVSQDSDDKSNDTVRITVIDLKKVIRKLLGKKKIRQAAPGL